MLQIHTLVLGLFQVNCYIVHKQDSRKCLVIDPGDAPKKILAFLQETGLEAEAVLLTHGHFDHVGAMRALAMELDCPVYIRDEEHTMPTALTAGPLGETVSYPDSLSLAGMDISVHHTPGHTPGSVCLCIEDVMFSGDTLFAGSCGRTDLPGGNWDTIQNSLNYLKNLPGDYRVFPGHGEETTLSCERQTNPYLR
ncbi:MAG: MBL fold metallo-hydrolase [Ruminococcaceae bacterium]|nr:MBL fold metallo-hydrolase [Oscillospiraceae bacterium]